MKYCKTSYNKKWILLMAKSEEKIPLVRNKWIFACRWMQYCLTLDEQCHGVWWMWYTTLCAYIHCHVFVSRSSRVHSCDFVSVNDSIAKFIILMLIHGWMISTFQTRKENILELFSKILQTSLTDLPNATVASMRHTCQW